MKSRQKRKKPLENFKEKSVHQQQVTPGLLFLYFYICIIYFFIVIFQFFSFSFFAAPTLYQTVHFRVERVKVDSAGKMLILVFHQNWQIDGTDASCGICGDFKVSIF